jgi:hypothetical protein
LIQRLGEKAETTDEMADADRPWSPL